MGKIIRRTLQLKLPANRSAFLWGPRKVGKSYWIREHLPKAPLIDLLKTDVFADFAARPSLLRERYTTHKELIVIDEIQKLPQLLNEVHWLIENSANHFLLTGSSARKLKRGNANLLGGRAWKKLLMPLTYQEVTGFNLENIMVSGLLAPHFLSPNPIEDLRAYVSDYLKEEIAAEAQIQNIPAFNEFLKVAALTNSDLLNYTNVARETGVSAKIVRTYFDILEDTYLGFRIPPWKKSKSRRMIETEKFYLFDVGLTNHLARRQPKQGTTEFGKSFEHYILMELKAYQAYMNPDMEISFWRTSTGQEVDFILGDMQVALEIKSNARSHANDVKHLLSLQEDGFTGHGYVVSLESQPRQISKNLTVLPWKIFLEKLWSGKIIK